MQLALLSSTLSNRCSYISKIVLSEGGQGVILPNLPEQNSEIEPGHVSIIVKMGKFADLMRRGRKGFMEMGELASSRGEG